MKKIVSINPATGEVNEEFEPYSEDRVNEVIIEGKSCIFRMEKPGYI